MRIKNSKCRHKGSLIFSSYSKQIWGLPAHQVLDDRSADATLQSITKCTNYQWVIIWYQESQLKKVKEKMKACLHPVSHQAIPFLSVFITSAICQYLPGFLPGYHKDQEDHSDRKTLAPQRCRQHDMLLGFNLPLLLSSHLEFWWQNNSRHPGLKARENKNIFWHQLPHPLV